jgi:hypothetical protein
MASAKAGATSVAGATVLPRLLGDPLDEALDAREGGLGLAQGLLAVLDHRAVVRGAQVVAQAMGRPVLDHLGDEHRVAERLAHLLAAHRDPGVVHPIRGEIVAVRLGLRDLVLVVREDQVEAAAVDVEGGAQVLVGHGRALQVPAGAAAAPRRLPGGLARLGRLPHREVARVALAGDALLGGLAQIVDDVLVGQRQIAGEGAHVEVDAAVGLVGTGWLRKTPTAITWDGTRFTSRMAVLASTRRGLSENMKPMASAPASTATSTSRSVFKPQILMNR